ncbi:unnamed protein product, partial [Discosporangium mesarthrocarpum]
VSSGVVGSPQYAVQAVKLVFTMLTEKMCDHMELLPVPSSPLEASPDSGGKDGNSRSGSSGGGSGGVGGVKAARSTAASPPSLSFGRASGGLSGFGGGRSALVASDAATVRNADAAVIILGILPHLEEQIACGTLAALNKVVRAGSLAEVEALVKTGAVKMAAEELALALQRKRAGRGGVAPAPEPHPRRTRAGSLPDSTELTPITVSSGGRPRPIVRGISMRVKADLQVTERLQSGLIEFLLLVATRYVTIRDLGPIMRSITLPLMMDAKGRVAPPTLWPAGIALPPSTTVPSPAPPSTAGGGSPAVLGGAVAAPISGVGEGGSVWLPGWGTFMRGPISDTE